MTRNIFAICASAGLFLTGCGHKSKPNLADLFPRQIELRSELIQIKPDDILTPMYTTIFTDYLICANYQAEKYLRIYDLRSGKIVGDQINIGRGPTELLGVSSLYCYNDKLIIYSHNSHKILTIGIDELLNDHPRIVESDVAESCLRVLPVAHNQYIWEGCLDESHLKLVNMQGGVLSQVEVYPNNGDNSGDNRLIWQGALTASPDGTHFAFSSSAGTIFKFWEVTNKGFVKKTMEHVFNIPKYTMDSDPDQDRYAIIWDELCPAGSLDLTAGSKYCFFLHDENKLMTGNEWRVSTVLVFDWAGNPISKLHLDKPMESIAYYEKENALVGLTSGEKGDPMFVSYKLPDMI